MASIAIVAGGMAGMGWLAGQAIADGLLHRTAVASALYVDGFVAPFAGGIDAERPLGPGLVTRLDTLVQDSRPRQRLVAFKLWAADGRLLYSTDRAQIGKQFPLHDRLVRAWGGEVVADISHLGEAEHGDLREQWTRLLEVYAPLRAAGSDQIFAVAEFYQTKDELEAEIDSARAETAAGIGGAILVMCTLLVVSSRWASGTIARQQTELADRVAQLTALLTQNEQLHRRVREAAARNTALQERFLRRVGAELHDGPAQEVGLALLRLDDVLAANPRPPSGGRATGRDDGLTISHALQRALAELRAIAAGLTLPELGRLTLGETVRRAVAAHEQRTGSRVTLRLGKLPEHLPEPVAGSFKVTLYRLIQESLYNAFRHAGGVGQRVEVRVAGDHLRVEIADNGPGFDVAGATGDGEQHLGLATMRERVESLGGALRVESAPGRGTRVTACLGLGAGRRP